MPSMKQIGLFLIPVFVCAGQSGQQPAFNEAYRGADGEIFSRKPNAFLAEMIRGRTPGTALDVGMGQGRNAIFLAQQGWQVSGFDISDEGVKQARAEAVRLHLRLNAAVASWDSFDFGSARWDLVVLVYVAPDKNLASKVVHALRPGGAVIVEDRHIDSLRVWPEGTYSNNELMSLFPGLRVLRYEDTWGKPDWQAKHLDERLVRLLAEKPSLPQPGCLWENKQVVEGKSACWDGVVKFECGRNGWVFTHQPCTN
jgi:SAM-dependent methyltransferase